MAADAVYGKDAYLWRVVVIVVVVVGAPPDVSCFWLLCRVLDPADWYCWSEEWFMRNLGGWPREPDVGGSCINLL